ncbi:hypothetical protein T484DRAFT_1670173 [Baffinella frigidus]|nr:hypothetical protein T484DRAFT_1670173 [Cryptophyta sp. CCMP2293]
MRCIVSSAFRRRLLFPRDYEPLLFPCSQPWIFKLLFFQKSTFPKSENEKMTFHEKSTFSISERSVAVMNLAFHTAGVPYAPAHKGSCLDPAFTRGCKNKSAGYVTLHMTSSRHEPLTCMHTPGGQGICWPGGESCVPNHQPSRPVQIDIFWSHFPLGGRRIPTSVILKTPNS